MNTLEFLKDDVTSTREKSSLVSLAIQEFLTSEKTSLILVANSFDKNKLKELEKILDNKKEVLAKLDKQHINISSVYSCLKSLVSKEVYTSMLSNNKIKSSKIDNYKKRLVIIEK